ncbi:MAG TPA: VOC family protein [Pseudonocardiaceae bacterium]|jgi:PhnB protein|nr:VOC family protein [Pseudonocardiaceae bacterium]
MAARLNPFLNFTGSARQAMEFYRDVFGGSLRMDSYADTGATDMPNPEHIMHAQLETAGGYTIMAYDVPAGTPHTPGDTVQISLSGDDEQELRGYWDQLRAGGTVTTPLAKASWGDDFGVCVDRFGITWMVDIHEVGRPTEN